jgi:acyl-coenzyme A thioesterase PaaI-like protein
MEKVSLSEGQRGEILAIAAQVRRLNATVTSLSGSEAELASLRTEAESLANKVAALNGEPSLEHYSLDFADKLNNMLPRSLISGEFNPMAAPVQMHTDGKYTIGTINFHKGFEGPPDCAHGAIVAGVFDQVLAMANVVNQCAGFTANLNIDYLKPTPLHQPLEFRCWTEDIGEDKVLTKGECYHGDTLLTKASGLFIRYRPEKHGRHDNA